MKLTVKNSEGNDQGELEVQFSMIENGKGTQAVHDVVVAHQAAQRSGTACTKTMGEVAGSGKKPWRQKGTGRARAGSFASPLWRGGGVVFGPKPRDFRKTVSKSTKKLAMRKALSERLKLGDVLILDDLKINSKKTKEFLRIRSSLQLQGTTLLVTESPNQNLILSSRNVAGVELATGDSVNTYQLLRSDRLVFTRAAFEIIERRLAGE